MPLRVPYGRVYAFYVHNTDNVTKLPPTWRAADGIGRERDRVDTLGHFMFRYSDDGGRTWSPERYKIPMRAMRMTARTRRVAKSSSSGVSASR